MFGVSARALEAEDGHSSACAAEVAAEHVEDAKRLMAKSDNDLPLRRVQRGQKVDNKLLRFSIRVVYSVRSLW